MKNDWTLRWWDALALLAAVVAGVLAVQYAVARGANGKTLPNIAVAEIRVLRPLPELGAQLLPGDAVKNSQGQKVAEIISIQPILPSEGSAINVPVLGKQDLLIKLRVSGNMRLMRNLPGFPQEPGSLKAGVWCLIATDKVEISGQVIRVEWISPEPGNRL